MTPQRRNKNVAVHEAGHAVAAHDIGLWFDYVTIDGQPRVEHSSPTSIERNHRWFPAEDLAMYRLAGGLAEQKISKKSHMSVFGLGPAESDWREFLRLGVDVASGHRLAVEFVRRRWAGITAVAMVLARDGTLSPDAVHRILAQEGGAR